MFLSTSATGSVCSSIDGSEDGSDESHRSWQEEVFDTTSVGESKRRIGSNRRSESQTKKTYKKAGKIIFTTEYNQNTKTLEVHIIRTFDLAPKRDIADVNPSVRIYLLPGKKQKQNTKYQKRTKDPYINERINLSELGVEELAKYKLKIKVYNHGLLKKNDLLGEVDLALSSLDLTMKETFNVDLFRVKSQVS